MKYFAIIGNPVFHSKSPDIFKYIFTHENIDAKYIKLAAHNVKDAIKMFNQMHLSGANITAPFKQEIIPFLDEISDIAKATNSVNTIVKKDGKLIGYNTDYYGILNNDIDYTNKNCLILGAGGAASSIIYAIKNIAKKTTVLNRTIDKAKKLAEKYNINYASINEINSQIQQADIIINSLPSGVNIIDKNSILPKHTIFDANYNNSIYSQIAQEKGAKYVSGTVWLINQAIPAYKLFFDNKYNTPDMSCFIFPQSKPEKLILIGFMGSGKSTIGKKLSEKFGYKVFSTDDIIATKEGKSINEIFNQNGEKFFRAQENDIIKILSQMAGKGIVSTGGGLVLSAENRKIIAENYTSIWLYADVDAIMKRTNPENRPLLKNNFNKEFVENLMNERFEKYIQAADIVINTSEQSIDEVFERLKNELKNINF